MYALENALQYKYLYLLILLFIAAEIIINPIGEFPLNDDWAYSRLVFNYVENGVITSTGWEGSLFYPQMFLGIFLSTIFGFSFSMLRITVVIISIIGLVLFFIIFNRLTKSVGFTTIGSVLIVFNPIYLQYTNTFYPDIPYTIVTFLSFWFLLHFLCNGYSRDYLLGLFFAIVAVSLKQTGVSILLAFAVTYLIFNKKNLKSFVFSFFPIIAIIFLLLSYKFFSESMGVLPGYGSYSDMANIIFRIIINPTITDFQKISYYTLNTTLVLGLFGFPVAIPSSYLLIRKKEFTKLQLSWLIVGFFLYTLVIVIKIFLRGKYIPFSSNNVYDIGLGSIVLTGIDQNMIPGIPGVGQMFWFFMSLVGAIGFVSMIFLFILSIKEYLQYSNTENKNHVIASVFSLLVLLVFIVPHLLVNVMARYMMNILPFLLVVIFSSLLVLDGKYSLLSQKLYRNSLLFFTPIIVFGILATHDYMSFNRTKWDALRFLTEKEKIPVEKIDGGFEFNEWYLSHLYIWKMTDDPKKKGRFWPVVDDEYIVTVTEIEGYEMFKQLKYKRWLPPGKHNINVLRRTTR